MKSTWHWGLTRLHMPVHTYVIGIIVLIIVLVRFPLP